MNEYICQYCGKVCKSKMSKTRHEYFCKLNPDYAAHIQKHKETTVKASKSETVLKKTSEAAKLKHQKFLESHPEEQYKDYELTCRKCGCTFIRRIKVKHFESNYRIPQFCCQEHANSHVHTEESKKKISESVSKERMHTCPLCGKEFMHKGSSISTTWCDECFEKICGFSRENKLSNKRSYIHGNPRKIGNDVELHSSNCPECGKLIWSKTSDEVYCYECCEKLHKRIHELFTEDGKRLVSDKTKQKLHEQMQERIKNGTHIGWTVRPIASYPEKFWQQVLQNNNIEFEFNFYIQKKSLGLNTLAGYFLDFKLKNNIDLEIDGKQHKYEDRKQSDVIRDKALTDNGWKVYRIEWNEINSEKGKQLMKQKINDFLNWYNINS